jgi:hypothetical protein
VLAVTPSSSWNVSLRPNPPPKLRFAIYLEGDRLPGWRREAIAHLRNAGDATLVLVILGASSGLRPEHSPRGLLWDWYLSRWVDRVCGARTLERACLATGTTETVAYHPAPRLERTSASAALRAIARHQLDFILDCGSGTAAADLAECARYGVWRFSDGHSALGDYPFLHDMCGSGSTISCALEQLQGAAEPANLLFYGNFKKVDWSYPRTLGHALRQAARWPMLVAKRIVLNGTVQAGSRPQLRPSAGSAVPPRLSHLARRVGSSLIRRLWNEVFCVDSWNVGVIELRIQDLVAGARRPARWLPRHRFGCFIADPFIYRTGPRVTCLVEDCSHFRRGRIAEVAVWPPTAKLELTPVLERDYHLSYPHIFRRDQDTFCLPEAQENSELLLYRCGPDNLRPIGSLLAGRRVADATLVEHEDRYWLFCGLEDDHVMTNLHVFFADDLLGPWHPHPLNPVKMDVASSRPAGDMFRVDGHLYRPAQNCAVTYGGGIWINRIDVLTTTDFAETPVIELRPRTDAPFNRGLHTLSIGDGLLVIDGKARTGPLASFASLPFRVWRRVRARRAFRPLRRRPGAAETANPPSGLVPGTVKTEPSRWRI